MPPKVKVTKEAIVEKAVALVRQSGPDAINARTLAMALECSTQPIFSNFATMEELRLSVRNAAVAMSEEYLAKEVQKGNYPPYKACGMAYIRFAKEEKELFKLLYMSRRTKEEMDGEESEENRQFDRMVEKICENGRMNQEEARRFHLEMWAFVHGIATMFATDFLDLPWELVDGMLSDVYQGLCKQSEREG